jgi:aminopeptidase N
LTGRISLVLLGLAWTSPFAAADHYPRQPGVDVLHYAFSITLRDDSDAIAGETKIDVRFVKDGVAELVLDLASAADGKGMAVSAVMAAGLPASYVHKNDQLRIKIDPPVRASESRHYTISYRGVPASGLRIGANRHGQRTFFSQNWPDKARQWLPLIDHPYDKATSEFIVTAPARYQVVANGLLLEETDLGDGRRRTHWKQSVPIASWLNTLGVAQFSSHHAGQIRGVPLQTWVYPQDRDAGIAALEAPARKALEFYCESIGPYPYEKLANVQAAGVNGGMEHASAIFYGENSFLNRPAATLVAHEIAHQWFGDSVTEKDWDDVWLSEGFATYFALLYTEHYDGREAFLAGLKRSRSTVFATEKRRAGLGVIHDNLSDQRQVLNPLVYQKGGWTLHMLRGQVGPDRFWAGIRGYYKRFRDGNATTDDLRHVMEENSGQNLAWFFNQWLHRSGSPVVEGSWRYDVAAKRITVELAQTQLGDLYRLPLELGVYQNGAAPPRIAKIEMTQRQQQFEVTADQAPSTVDLDPNTWMLMQAKFSKKTTRPVQDR